MNADQFEIWIERIYSGRALDGILASGNIELTDEQRRRFEQAQDFPNKRQRETDAAGSRDFDAHFGVCPLCLNSGVMRNIGRTHVMACDEHRVRWNVGSNLFSAWRNEPESLHRENAALLESYTDVEDEVSQIISAIASTERKHERKHERSDEVEVEHICDCGATSWFEMVPRKDYQAMLPKGTDATLEANAVDLPF